MADEDGKSGSPDGGMEEGKEGKEETEVEGKGLYVFFLRLWQVQKKEEKKEEKTIKLCD